MIISIEASTNFELTQRRFVVEDPLIREVPPKPVESTACVPIISVNGCSEAQEGLGSRLQDGHRIYGAHVDVTRANLAPAVIAHCMQVSTTCEVHSIVHFLQAHRTLTFSTLPRANV
jgi:hypothetical protein